KMEVQVKVHPRSRDVRIIASSRPGCRTPFLEVWLTEPAEDNRANVQLLKALSGAFKCSASLIRGHKSKSKLVTLCISEEGFSGIAKGFRGK
ncbi:MAG: DUF167 family protein, partial [Candidatus Micrarchaeota archaeon]|nr:DUF167 family protein [Candidatus Micrarchaeota archaeon]